MEFKNFLDTKRKKKTTIVKPTNVEITMKIENEQSSANVMNTVLRPTFLGEMFELPPTTNTDDGTLVRIGKSIYIQQNNVWELLSEGIVEKKQVIQYGIPGGGCGVDEVKKIINETALTKGTGIGVQGTFVGTFDSISSLPLTANPGDFATTRDGVFYVWGS